MKKIWKVRNGVLHGVTKEERRKRVNDRVLPLVRAAYRTHHLDISLYKMSLFRWSLEQRLQMEPNENEGWIEIVATTKRHKRVREEAVLLATRKITSYFVLQNQIRETSSNNGNAWQRKMSRLYEKCPSGFLPCGQVIGAKLYLYVLYRFTLCLVLLQRWYFFKQPHVERLCHLWYFLLVSKTIQIVVIYLFTSLYFDRTEHLCYITWNSNTRTSVEVFLVKSYHSISHIPTEEMDTISLPRVYSQCP